MIGASIFPLLLSVQLQTKSPELTHASQQLGWSSGKAERMIA
jgi:hypothetical protein